MRRVERFLFLVVILVATPVTADELQLRNGDRLTGTTVTLAGGTLTFATAYGDVRVPWAQVMALTVTDPIIVTADGVTALQQGGPIAIATVTALSRQQPRVTIDGGANAGMVTTAGNTGITNVRLDGDLSARDGANRYTVSAISTRSKDRGVETARNWSSTVKYDRFLSERLFVNGNAIFTSDRFRDLDLRSALGAGVGYQVLTRPRVTLTADGGIGYVNENLEAGLDDSYAALHESAALNVAIWPDRIQFFHQQDAYVGVSGEDNLFVKMQNGLRIGLAAGFVTTLRHDLDYDRSPSPGRETTDRTLSLTFGYRF